MLRSVVADLRTAPRSETVTTMLRAAFRRYSDSWALVTSGDEYYTGGIYLAGYVVEMLLKVGFARLHGATGRALISGYFPRGRANLHDVLDWLQRIEAMRPHPDPSFMGDLRFHVLVIHERWTEALRYNDYVSTEMEANDVFESCSWIVTNFTRIWRD